MVRTKKTTSRRTVDSTGDDPERKPHAESREDGAAPRRRQTRNVLHDVSNRRPPKKSSGTAAANNNGSAKAAPPRRSSRLVALNDKVLEELKSKPSTMPVPSEMETKLVAAEKGRRNNAPERPLRRRAGKTKNRGDILGDDFLSEKPTVPNLEKKKRTSSTERASVASKRGRLSVSSDSGPSHRHGLQNGLETEAGIRTAIAPHDKRNLGKAEEVPEYVTEMYQHFYQTELLFSAVPYTPSHNYLQPLHREEIVDWLVYLNLAQTFDEAVLYLAIQILDRYSAIVDVDFEDYHLVAGVSLLIASKYEEVTPIDVSCIVSYMSCNVLPSDVVEVEYDVLEALKYRISGPTAYHFLVRFLNVVQPAADVTSLACYFMECALSIEGLLLYRPSAVAATAVCLAIRNPKVKGVDAKSVRLQRKLIKYCMFPVALIVQIAKIIEGSFDEPPPRLQATIRDNRRINISKQLSHSKIVGFTIWTKYNRNRHHRISDICSPPQASHIADQDPVLSDRDQHISF